MATHAQSVRYNHHLNTSTVSIILTFTGPHRSLYNFPQKIHLSCWTRLSPPCRARPAGPTMPSSSYYYSPKIPISSSFRPLHPRLSHLHFWHKLCWCPFRDFLEDGHFYDKQREALVLSQRRQRAPLTTSCKKLRTLLCANCANTRYALQDSHTMVVRSRCGRL